MKIALISDIHGNLQALQAVIQDIDRNAIQSIICLGDIISMGLQPGEVITMLQSIHCSFILGNHDEPFIDFSQMGMLSVISEEVFISNKWTLGHISEPQREFIRTFKSSVKLQDARGRKIYCFHGTPKHNYEGISPDTDDDSIHVYLDECNDDIFVCGHTHRQMRREFNGKIIINPGSVGSVFNESCSKGNGTALQPWAEYGILDLSKNNVSFEMEKIPFNISQLQSVIDNTDHPYKEWWKNQYFAHRESGAVT
ncbi:MAG: metallophosphoesterase family protein [Spirochaetes bacterium]|nr:metallophosphoesterase family protein [Spirochaetota bacterium]